MQLNTANHKIRYALAHKEAKIDRFVDINANELMNNETVYFTLFNYSMSYTLMAESNAILK